MAKPKMTLREYCEQNPDRAYLLDEWDYEANGELTPDNVGYGSEKKVWWVMLYIVPDDHPIKHLRGKRFDFEWEANIGNRVKKGYGCPFLTGQAVWVGFNDLATVNPELAKEWHPLKNGDLKPMDVTSGSGQKVWWYLPYDVPDDHPIERLRGKHFDFEWKSDIVSRNCGNGCPFLQSKAVWIGFNDLGTLYPEIAKEWHPTKNGNLTAFDVITQSNKKVWWYFSYDVSEDYPVEHLRGKHFDFEWEATICDRVSGTGCPYLSIPPVAIWKGFNDLATKNPYIAAQWDYERNFPLTPSDVFECANQKYWWIYSYDDPITGKHFNFSWQESPGNRKYWPSCPFLTMPPKRLWKGFNDLETRNPQLAAEWHPTLNGDLTPSDVFPSADKRVWWLLSYDEPEDSPFENIRGKHFDFVWASTINNRDRGKGCPYLDSCTSPTVWKGFNDLGTRYPDVAKEWHPTKNGSLSPKDVTAGSNKKVWWKCPVCGHEWNAMIASRTGFYGSKCPKCFESKGEKAIRKVLEANCIKFEAQHKFKDRGLLRDDFAILNEDNIVVATIEFNGQQHYEPVDFARKGINWAKGQLKKIQERDKIKSDYLKTHNIPQLIIPYWDFDKIQTKVLNFLKNLNLIA